MPVWNGEEHLRAAVESVLGQTFEDFELLLVDDGSSDSTPAIIEEFARADPRVRPLRLPHGGLIRALNFGIEEASAPWIARFDADDIALPHWLEVLWAARQRYPEAVLFHGGGKTLGATSQAKIFGNTSRALHALQLCFLCPVLHPSCMFNREAMLAAGQYAKADLHTEDYGAWGRLLEYGPFIKVPQALFWRRIHAGSVSLQNLRTQKEHTRRIAIGHCRKFMELSESDAERAWATLVKLPTTDFSDWLWFSTHCLPRLRWLDARACLWVSLRLGRSFFRKRKARA